MFRPSRDEPLRNVPVNEGGFAFDSSSAYNPNLVVISRRESVKERLDIFLQLNQDESVPSALRSRPGLSYCIYP